jgi:hypothetical protein
VDRRERSVVVRQTVLAHRASSTPRFVATGGAPTAELATPQKDRGNEIIMKQSSIARNLVSVLAFSLLAVPAAMAQKATSMTGKSPAVAKPVDLPKKLPSVASLPSVDCGLVLEYLRTNATQAPGVAPNNASGLFGHASLDEGAYFGSASGWAGRKAGAAESYEFAGDVFWATRYVGTKQISRTVKINVGKWAAGQMAVVITDKDKAGATTTYVDAADAKLTCGQNSRSVWLSGSVYQKDDAAPGWRPFSIVFGIVSNEIN